MIDLNKFLSPSAAQTIKSAGLHQVAGEMTGAGELTMPKVAALIGMSSFVRRKRAALIAGGLESLKTLLP